MQAFTLFFTKAPNKRTKKQDRVSYRFNVLCFGLQSCFSMCCLTLSCLSPLTMLSLNMVTYIDCLKNHVHRPAIVVVHLLSYFRLFTTPWMIARQTPLFFTISWNVLKLVSIESVIPSNHLILGCPLLLLPSIFPIIRDFSNELSPCIRCPKYWPMSMHPKSII